MPNPLEELRVVLVAPRNPLNIGAAARAMRNFGFAHLRVVNPYDVAYAEAKSAVKASGVLAQSQQYPTVAEAVADCSLVVGTVSPGHRWMAHSLRRLETGGQLIREELTRGRVALLFGSEKFGLGNEDLAHCHWLMTIPTGSEQESMNLGQAVAVCLYELIRREEAEAHAPVGVRRAESADVERISTLLFDALRLSGWVQERAAHSAELKVRRLVRRMEMSAADGAVWLGMLRQILWKLNQSEPRG